MQAGHARRPGRDPRRDTWSAPHRQAAAASRHTQAKEDPVLVEPTPTPTRDGGDADPTTRPNHMHQLTTCTTACTAAGRAELTPGPDPGSGRSLRPAGGLPPANAHLPHRRRCLLLPPLSTASCGCSPGTNHSSRAGAVPCPGDVAVGRSSAARSAQFLPDLQERQSNSPVLLLPTDNQHAP
jgi:hypothetical protein